MTARQFLRLVLPSLLLLPCACESDSVSWAFVSNPGGSWDTGSGGGAIIVVKSGGSGQATLATGMLQISGRDDRGELTVFLPQGGDVAVLVRAEGAELRSPALPAGRIELPGAQVSLRSRDATAMQLSLPACGVVHPAVSGPGSLRIAATGTLLVLEGSNGLVIFGERPDPEFVPSTASLTATPGGDRLALLLGDGRLRALTPPPPPAVEQRLEPLPARGSLRLLGPVGECLAELPVGNVRLQHGMNGLFLLADPPPGGVGGTAGAMLVMARDNRYLLRMEPL